MQVMIGGKSIASESGVWKRLVQSPEKVDGVNFASERAQSDEFGLV